MLEAALFPQERLARFTSSKGQEKSPSDHWDVECFLCSENQQGIFGHGMFANAMWTVEDKCIVRTKVVVTDALSVEMRGTLMVLITGRELNFALRQKAGEFSSVEENHFRNL
jgi:hypothetical protein